MPARVTFLGERSRRALAPDDADFVEIGGALDLAHADVVVCLSPEAVAPGSLAQLDAAVLAVATPQALGGRVDRSNFDRVVATSPRLADELDVWRTIPVPVGDRFFAEVGTLTGEPRMLVDSDDRAFLESVGLAEVPTASWPDADEELAQVLASADVAIFTRGEADDPRIAERVSFHLAAGHLVVGGSRRLRHDLQPGVHYFEARSGVELWLLATGLRRWPDSHDVVRLRGRERAERSRASTLYARLIDDFERELGLFGSERPNVSTSRTRSRTIRG